MRTIRNPWGLAMLLVVLTAAGTMVGAMDLKHRLSVDFREADIRDILKLIAEKTGANIVVEKSVRGMVTIKVRDMPADELLTMLLTTNGFAWIRTDHGIMVGDERKIVSSVTRVVTLTHVAAAEVAKVLCQAIKRDVKVATLDEGNAVVVAGSPEVVREAQAICTAIDRPAKAFRARIELWRRERRLRALSLICPVGETVKVLDNSWQGKLSGAKDSHRHLELEVLLYAHSSSARVCGQLSANYRMELDSGLGIEQKVELPIAAVSGKPVNLGEMGDPSELRLVVSFEPLEFAKK